MPHMNFYCLAIEKKGSLNKEMLNHDSLLNNQNNIKIKKKMYKKYFTIDMFAI